MSKLPNAKERLEKANSVLPAVRELVKKFDLAAVNKAVTMLYDERKAENALKAAQANVKALKSKLRK